MGASSKERDHIVKLMLSLAKKITSDISEKIASIENSIKEYVEATKYSSEESARIGAEVALKKYCEYEERRKKEQADCRLRNTKMLLKNYRLFKAHSENAIYTVKEAREKAEWDIIEIMSDRYDNNDMFVESIERTAARTFIMVRHIEKMMEVYKEYCYRYGGPEEVRKWNVIYGKYISDQPMTKKQLADTYGCVDRTIDRDVDDACEKIAALIFGIDGIKR